MLQVVAVEDGQLYGTADAVVGTQRRALSGQPLAVDIGLDGVAVEVELHVDELVAHHVHVALQDDRLSVFVAFGGWLAYDDVTGFVDFRVQTASLAPVFQILNHFLLALRRAWNFVDLRKLLEDNGRF